MAKRIQLNARITKQQDQFLKENEIGKTTLVEAGFALLRMYRQGYSAFTCPYLTRTGKTAPRPAAAVDSLDAPPAHACPCPGCPIARAFQTVPHAQKKDEPARAGLLAAADQSYVGPGGSYKLVEITAGTSSPVPAGQLQGTRDPE